GWPPRRARPSASRRRSEGSTVITAVLRLADAPASASAAAIVVLPTPPVPSRIGIEPLVSRSFKAAAPLQGDGSFEPSRPRCYGSPQHAQRPHIALSLEREDSRRRDRAHRWTTVVIAGR